MNIGQHCNRRVVKTTRNERVLTAARRMRDEHVGDLVVVEETDGRFIPLGVLTDRDIVVGILAQDIEHLSTLDVGDVLTREVVTARETDDLPDVLQRMVEHGVRRMPVVDTQGTLVGIFTLDDWLATLSRDLQGIVRLIARERRDEAERRP
jgi:CBS domain-containing protein